jgi:hypothetical protein
LYLWDKNPLNGFVLSGGSPPGFFKAGEAVEMTRGPGKPFSFFHPSLSAERVTAIFSEKHLYGIFPYR